MSSSTGIDATKIEDTLFDNTIKQNFETTDSIHVTQIKKYMYNTQQGAVDKFRVLKRFKSKSNKQDDIESITKSYINLDIYKHTGIALPVFLRMTFDEIQLVFDVAEEYLETKQTLLSDQIGLED